MYRSYGGVYELIGECFTLCIKDNQTDRQTDRQKEKVFNLTSQSLQFDLFVGIDKSLTEKVYLNYIMERNKKNTL